MTKDHRETTTCNSFGPGYPHLLINLLRPFKHKRRRKYKCENEKAGERCKPETTRLFKVLRFESNAPPSVLRSQEIVRSSPITADVAFSGLLVKRVRRDFNLSLPCAVSSTKIQPRKQATSRMGWDQPDGGLELKRATW